MLRKGSDKKMLTLHNEHCEASACLPLGLVCGYAKYGSERREARCFCIESLFINIDDYGENCFDYRRYQWYR